MSQRSTNMPSTPTKHEPRSPANTATSPTHPTSSSFSFSSSAANNLTSSDNGMIQNFFLLLHSSMQQQNSERNLEKLKYISPLQITHTYPNILFKKLIQQNLTLRDQYDLLRECYQVITLPVAMNRAVDFTNHSGIVLFLVKLIVNAKTAKKIKILILTILTNVKLLDFSQFYQLNENLNNTYMNYLQYYSRVNNLIVNQLVGENVTMDQLVDVLYLNHKMAHLSDTSKIQVYECDGVNIHPMVISGSSKSGNSTSIYTVLNKVKHHSLFSIQSNYSFSLMKQELLKHFKTLSKSNIQMVLRYNLRLMQQCEYMFQHDCDCAMYISSVMMESIGQMDILCCKDSHLVNQVFPVLKKIFLTITNNTTILQQPYLGNILLECIKFFIHHSYTFIYDPNMLIERFFAIYWNNYKSNILLHLELLNMLIVNHSFIVEHDLNYIYKHCYKTVFNIFSIIPYKVYHLVHVLLPCLINEQSYVEVFQILTSYENPIFNIHINNFLKLYFSTLHHHDEYLQTLIPVMIDKINVSETQEGQNNRYMYEDVIIEQLTNQVHKVYTNMTLSNSSNSHNIISKMKTVLHSNNDRLFQSVCFAFANIVSDSNTKIKVVQSIYESLEVIVYEKMMQFKRVDYHTSNMIINMNLLLNSLCKCALRYPDLLVRCKVCLTNIIKSKKDAKYCQYAVQLYNTLKYPNIANNILL